MQILKLWEDEKNVEKITLSLISIVNSGFELKKAIKLPSPRSTEPIDNVISTIGDTKSINDSRNNIIKKN